VRRPVLTVYAVTVAAVAGILQYAVPAMVPATERVPGGLARGEWWRLVTPLLVQTLGWYHVLANLVTLAVVGLVCERLLGRWWWLVLFTAGTVGGQVAAYRWGEPGGGDSIAICGLAAGVLVAQLFDREPPRRWAGETVVCYIAALAGWAVAGPLAAGAGVVIVVASFVLLWRLAPDGKVRFVAYKIGLLLTAVVAGVLATSQDLHGAALSFTIVVATVPFAIRWGATNRR
jgi:membrane associated rhomboid family serine protease